MSWVEHPSELALSEGSTLWVVGDLNSSAWAKKINWYLNFQLRRAKFHKTREMPQELRTVLQTWDVEAPELKLDSSAPLLVESSKLLPNQITVQLFNNRTFDSWVDEAIQVWNDLQRPSVRVFLPFEKTVSELTSRWKLPEAVSGTYVQE